MPPHPTTLFFILRTLTFFFSLPSQHIFLAHSKPFRGRYWLEPCLLPQLYGVSRSLPASKLQQCVHKQHSNALSVAGPPASKSQSLPWQDGPESQHFKMAQLFFLPLLKTKKHAVSFYQNHLSVSCQDLLMSCRLLQLKLSQEASLR